MKNLFVIEFFNKTSTKDLPVELRKKFEELLKMLPEYHSHVKKLGVFVVENLNEDNLKEAMRYTGKETTPWVQDAKAAQFYFEEVQAIVISKKKYRKLREIERKRVILHELVHGICRHEEKDSSVVRFFQDKYFRDLQEEQAKYVINMLINHHADFEADCLVAQKAPEIHMEYMYKYANDLSLRKIRYQVNKLSNLRGCLYMAIGLVNFYKNLATLKFLPSSFSKKSKYKKARDKLTILLKAARFRLMDFTNKTLPPVEEIITDADLADLSKLMSCYSKIVG